jgi:two-component system, chemotaxis family, chemotaxis protein CheY
MGIDANEKQIGKGRAMINLDDELAEDYLAECREHLDTVDTDLMAMENGGAKLDEELINRVFRALHSVKGGAGFFDLVKVRGLAHQMEEAMALIRSRKIVPTPSVVRVLLGANDRLSELLEDAGSSNEAEINELLGALAGLCTDHTSAAQGPVCAGGQRGIPLRVLLVEDNFASRLLLQTFLTRYGECHIAVNGREAVEAFHAALERGQSYDLVCMDIMMPEMDGREAVRRIRAMEEGRGILSTYGTKIIMTTAVDEIKDVVLCFKELCDAYLVKPIDLSQLLGHLRAYRLVR